VNLIQASNEFRRVSELYHQKDRLVSDTDYDLAQAQFEALQTDVEEKSKIVSSTQKTLDRLATMADSFVPGGENDWLKQALDMEEEKIKVFQERMKPLPLMAPIDGVVTLVHRRPGEQLIAGEAIATVTSKHSDRIVGYLPPTFPLTPKLGMVVEVSTRTFQRQKCSARIIGLGPHVEAVTNMMIAPPAMVRPIPLPATGRPVSISLPPGLRLLPGELVDITVRKARTDADAVGSE
jgi:multidrug resistance efflux pump